MSFPHVERTRQVPAFAGMTAASTSSTLIMGVMNITPDSFFDGGRIQSPEEAATRARQLIADGADILDVGAESTRPGAEPVSAEAEWARLAPVLEALCAIDSARVSVDTYKAEVARKAISSGASMVNDISGLRGDPAMAETVAEAGCECVIMHMQGAPKTMQEAPRYDDVVGDIKAFFEERIAYAEAQGIRRERIWIDPGFGFGKTPPQNLELIRRLREFKVFGVPILVGTSNKSTIGAVLDVPVHERMEGTAATVAISIWNGADAVRVHDVKAMARVAKMTDALARVQIISDQL
ncbi:MAG: hypothetical protein AMXMBFR84_11070 [Candidatus Hydrogenedentota bacterium]